MILNGVEKKLGDFFLDIKNFAVSKPGVYGVIGPNGSGKSTLAKILAGLMEPDLGNVDFEGLTSKDITFLGQKPYMMNDTVYNNLVYPLSLRAMDTKAEYITALMDMAKLPQRKKQKAKSLSGGEQQKLALLRAVIFKPSLVIADEAMGAMDMESLDFFVKKILEEQKKENSTWIIISHQIPHIRRICDYIFFIYEGKIEAQGAAKSFFIENENPRLKEYLKSFYG
jgi:ABC-type multidrug transport system ATPase subunit